MTNADATLTLNGDCAKNGVVECKDPKKVKITSAGDDSGIKFLVAGKDINGKSITEEITGANAKTSFGAKDFKKIDTITVKGGNAKVGVEVGLTQFYLDLDNDGKADLLKDGKITKDTDGDGKNDINVDKASDMTNDKDSCSQTQIIKSIMFMKEWN